MTQVDPAETANIRGRKDQNYRRPPGLRIRTAREAASFVTAVGFAVPYPQEGLELPSLWEAYVGRAGAPNGWDASVETVWGWKDELPANRWASYGAYFPRKPSLVSREMLGNLLAVAGPPDAQDLYDSGRLTHDALRVYENLAAHRPAARRALRVAAGMTGKKGNARFQRSMGTLERSLLVARVGVGREGPSGWPSTVYDVMADAFPDEWAQSRKIRPVAARDALLSRYLATVVRAHGSKIARLFGWRAQSVRDILARLGNRAEPSDGPGWWVWKSQ